MTRRLTDIAVKAIKPKAEYFEEVDGTSGLRLAIFPSGKKSWIARYRRPDSGKTAKLTIGKYPEISLSTARIRVSEARDAVSNGIDPGENKKRAKISADEAEAARRADTIELHVKQHLERTRGEVGKRHLSEGHWRQACLALECHAVAAWRGRPVSEILRRDVRELVEQVAAARGPIAGNRAFEHIRKFFNELVEREIVARSPCVGLKRLAKEQARERTLTEAEIKSLMAALDAIRGPTAAAIKLMLLTGQRRSEVAGMTWGEIIDGDWQLPGNRTKNRKSHTVPLSRQALAVIEQQPRIDGCNFIFTTTSSMPVVNFTRIKRQIDAIMKPEAPWVIHDLRRTVASGMAGLGVTLPTIEKTLNHASGTFRGVLAVYQRHDFRNEKRDALARWGDHIERIVKGKEPGKVVKLRG
jgi:integrase